MEWLGEYRVPFLLECDPNTATGCEEDHRWNFLGNSSPLGLHEVQEIQRSCQYSTKIYIEQDKRREAKSALSDPGDGWSPPGTKSRGVISCQSQHQNKHLFNRSIFRDDQNSLFDTLGIGTRW